MPSISAIPPTGKAINLFSLFIVLLLLFSGIYFTHNYLQHETRIKVDMKSGGRHGKHANQKAKQTAEEKYQEAKTEFEKLDSKTNKSPEEKTLLEKWRTQMKHWQKKKEWGGEHHSQKHKGN